jgi:hypothetical protein
MFAMSKKRRGEVEQPIFGSIRKPTAPPSRKLGDEKAEEKVHPAQRKVKHKKRIEISSGNGDF